MTDLVPFLVVGAASGSLYGLAGLGLVLTYRTSGIFNFAHGALAAAAAYLFYTLHFTYGWPWPLAGVVVIGGLGPVAGIVVERLARGLVKARPSSIAVGTIGLLLFVQGFLYWRYGPGQREFPNFLPTSTAVRISGVAVDWATVINTAIGFASFVGLYLFLRLTRIGVEMRAVVAAPDLASLSGTSPSRVRTVAWVIGSCFAALTGILLAPTLTLNAGLLSALVVQAFGAVAIGLFASLPFTYVGGLGIGVGAAVATKYLAARAPFSGIPAVIPFLVLIAVMLCTPARRLPAGAGRPGGARVRARWAPPRLSIGAGALAVGLLVAAPQLVGTRLPVYSAALVFVVLFLSLSLLTQVSGQISLAHAAFAGVGAASFSRLTVEAGYPWLVGLLAAGVLTGLVGVVLALPSMRLSGLYLALATFGFGLLMERVVFQTSLLFGSRVEGLRAFRPDLGPLDGTSDKTFYFVILAIALLTSVGMVAVQRARLGRFLRAMADTPLALTTMGLTINLTRVIVFASSAFLAGVAGGLYISLFGRVSAVTFNSLNSLLYLAVLTVAAVVARSVVSAYLAAALLVVVPSYLTAVTVDVQSMLFGGTAVLAALVADGQVDWRSVAARWRRRLDTSIAASDTRRRRGRIDSRPTVPVPGATAGAATVTGGPA